MLAAGVVMNDPCETQGGRRQPGIAPVRPDIGNQAYDIIG